jgi:predicted AlkP superfamily phosphohydrolase/phosphomutase
MTKLVALGIDGAPWELIDRFTETGSIPNIARLIETGVSAELLSTVPPVTAPAWKCYSTGKNPGKLGAYWWTVVDFKGRRISFTNSTDFRSKDYWDYAAEAGRFCIQVNMPMTYPPPSQFNGLFVSGVPGLENDPYTCPPGLKRELERRYGWRVTPRYDSFEVNPEGFLESVADLINTRFDFVEDNVARADLVHLTVFYIDDIQHYTWRQMKEGRGKHKDAIEDLWSLVDGRIGRLRGKIGEDHHFVINSDHGFTDFLGSFYINEWLRPGYLKVKEVSERSQRSLGKRMYDLTQRLRVQGLVRRFMSEKRRKRFQDRMQEETLEGAAFFDWDGTKVYGSAEGPIYINRDMLADEAEYEALRDQLVADLEAYTVPGTDRRVFERVYRKEEIYHGPFVDRAPDLVALPNLGYEISGQVSEGGTVWVEGGNVHNQWSGIHRMEGILVLNGPEVREGVRLDQARIYDVAPTILALMGLPIPDDVDGKVLVEAMREPDRYRTLQTSTGGIKAEEAHTYTPEEEQALEDRLRSLGYM